MANLAAWLLALVAPIAKRVLVALGIGVVSYAGYSALVDQVKTAIIAQWGQLGSATLALMSLGGVGEALGIILATLAASSGPDGLGKVRAHHLMITIITGTTGNGKTAMVVKWLSEVKDRPIFVMGIRDLTIPHETVPPVAEWTELRPVPEDPSLMQPWYTFPPNAIVVIDEAQNVFRPRASTSKVPDHVAALETHRHTGIDIWLITQDAAFLDANARRLCKRHVHLRDTFFGIYKHEWPRLGDPENKADREVSTTTKYTLPKEVFGLYKSAEAHTKVKRSIPKYVYVFLVAALVAAMVGYRIYNRIAGTIDDESVDQLQGKAAQQAKGAIATPESRPKSGEEYIQQYTPREFGFMHTAPAYDELTKAQTVPEAVGCYASQRTGCKSARVKVVVASVMRPTVEYCEPPNVSL